MDRIPPSPPPSSFIPPTEPSAILSPSELSARVILKARQAVSSLESKSRMVVTDFATYVSCANRNKVESLLSAPTFETTSSNAKEILLSPGQKPNRVKEVATLIAKRAVQGIAITIGFLCGIIEGIGSAFSGAYYGYRLYLSKQETPSLANKLKAIAIGGMGGFTAGLLSTPLMALVVLPATRAQKALEIANTFLARVGRWLASSRESSHAPQKFCSSVNTDLKSMMQEKVDLSLSIQDQALTSLSQYALQTPEPQVQDRARKAASYFQKAQIAHDVVAYVAGGQKAILNKADAISREILSLPLQTKKNAQGIQKSDRKWPTVIKNHAIAIAKGIVHYSAMVIGFIWGLLEGLGTAVTSAYYNYKLYLSSHEKPTRLQKLEAAIVGGATGFTLGLLSTPFMALAVLPYTRAKRAAAIADSCLVRVANWFSNSNGKLQGPEHFANSARGDYQRITSSESPFENGRDLNDVD